MPLPLRENLALLPGPDPLGQMASCAGRDSRSHPGSNGRSPPSRTGPDSRSASTRAHAVWAPDAQSSSGARPDRRRPHRCLLRRVRRRSARAVPEAVRTACRASAISPKPPRRTCATASFPADAYAHAVDAVLPDSRSPRAARHGGRLRLPRATASIAPRRSRLSCLVQRTPAGSTNQPLVVSDRVQGSGASVHVVVVGSDRADPIVSPVSSRPTIGDALEPDPLQ